MVNDNNNRPVDAVICPECCGTKVNPDGEECEYCSGQGWT